jgi:hypothetical protein
MSCKSVQSVVFEENSQLLRLEARAFLASGLTSIHLPASVTVIGESCFSGCGSLASITFESGSQLSQLAASLALFRASRSNQIQSDSEGMRSLTTGSSVRTMIQTQRHLPYRANNCLRHFLMDSLLHRNSITMPMAIVTEEFPTDEGSTNLGDRIRPSFSGLSRFVGFLGNRF